jgi:hypothetical protein
MRIYAAVVLLFFACVTANAQDFFATFSGAAENPDVVTSAHGRGKASYDAGTQMLTVDLRYSGLTQPATDAHIHCCATSDLTNAGVAIGFTGGNGFVLGQTSGMYTHTFDLGLQSTYNATYFTNSGGTVAQARDRLLNAMSFGVENNPLPGDSSIAYFNIHTGFAPGGEIRGNIFPVPEPASLVLVACGLATCGLRRRLR